MHKGDFQLTSQERTELTQQKRNEILHYFHSNYINPSNNLPHPITRYENAFTQLKINIDYLLPTDKQVREIHKKLSGVIPMKHKEIYLTLKQQLELAKKGVNDVNTPDVALSIFVCAIGYKK